MPPAPPPPPAERFARLIAALCEAVAARLGWLTGPVIILIWTRLRRMSQRMDRIAARAAAGPLPPPRRRPPAPRRSPARPRPPLPRDRAWLIRLVPATAFAAGQVQTLLDDPALLALLADAPQLGRTLRPLCRMLGVTLPPALRRPPPAATTPAATTPAATTPAATPPAPAALAPAARRPASSPAHAAPRRAAPRRAAGTPPAPGVARPAGAAPAPA